MARSAALKLYRRASGMTAMRPRGGAVALPFHADPPRLGRAARRLIRIAVADGLHPILTPVTNARPFG